MTIGRSSVLLRNEVAVLQRGLVIVRAFLRALGKFNFFARHLLIWNKAQQVGDAVEAGALLIVGVQNVPRCMLGIGGLEHQVARSGILIPFLARGQIDRAELPLAERILDARLEAATLLLVTDLQPIFDQLNAAIHYILLNL